MSRWHVVSTLDAPGAWLYRVGINLANSWFRRRAAEARANRRATDRDATPVAEDIETILTLRALVAGLPRRQRQAIILRYYLDLSALESARVMGCSDGTVRALTHQAIRCLRLSWSQAEEVLSE